MAISVCFSWTLDPYVTNFRFCVAVVSELKLTDEPKKNNLMV